MFCKIHKQVWKNNKKRSRHQYSNDDKIQQQQQQQQQIDQNKKNKKSKNNSNTQEQRLDPELARRFVPSRKRNDINKQELSEIQSQLNEISQQLERDLIRSIRLLKLKEVGSSSSSKKKQKQKEKNKSKEN